MKMTIEEWLEDNCGAPYDQDNLICYILNDLDMNHPLYKKAKILEKALKEFHKELDRVGYQAG